MLVIGWEKIYMLCEARALLSHSVSDEFGETEKNM